MIISKDRKIKPSIDWIKWTSKSQNLPFKSTIKGVGDGEQKVAAELDTFILGQNSSFDMNIIINGIKYEADVKKLDNFSFNTGVKGRNALRVIKTKITDLLNSFQMIEEFDNISPDELSVSNIKKIYNICETLNIKRQKIISNLPIIKPFIKNNGDIIEMNLFDYYKICLILNEPLPIEYDNFKNDLILLNDISHEYIIDKNKLKQSLNGLVSIFNDLKLIFVDEINGYFILNDISKIQFERITRGHPRFIIV